VIHIPKYAGSISRLASKDTTRYSTSGVQCLANGEECRLIATDGHCLGIVRLVCEPPGGEISALVPQGEWDKAFKAAGKDAGVSLDGAQLVAQGELPKAQRGVHSGREHLAGQRQQIAVPYTPVDGRFPDYMRVLPTNYPLFQCNLDPRLVIRVMEVALQIARQESSSCRVTWLFYSPDMPVGVCAVGKDGMTFDGLIMPLT
jgi:hypothetical protein